MSENIENTVQKEDAPDTQEPQTSQPGQDTQSDAASAAGSNVVPYPVSDKQKYGKNEPVANSADPANTATEINTENTHSTAEPVDETTNITTETVTPAAESVTSAVEVNTSVTEVTASVTESVNSAAQHKITEAEAISESTNVPENAQNIPQNNTQNDSHRNEAPDSATSAKSRTSHYEDPDDTEDLEEDFYEQQEKSRSKDEHPFREFFSNFRSKRKIEMNRDEQILSRISDDDLMEYLRMEQKRMELLQQAKEVREKRFWTTFQLFICLLSVVLVIYFLKDNPVILVTILYTIGILTALRIWSKSQNGRDRKDGNDSSGHHKKPWE